VEDVDTDMRMTLQCITNKQDKRDEIRVALDRFQGAGYCKGSNNPLNFETELRVSGRNFKTRFLLLL
jgi:hypothetical protein